MDHIGMAVAFTAGLFPFVSPCVLPLFPSYLSFLTGMSVTDLATDLTWDTRRRVLLHAVAFVVGFSMVFVALGASFSAVGQLLMHHRVGIQRAGGLLIILFGLSIAGVLRLGVLGRTAQWSVGTRPAGYVGSSVVGVAFCDRVDALRGADPGGHPLTG